MAKYNTLIMKMSNDNVSAAQARSNLDLICDLHMLLSLSYLLPLLEAMNVLIKFAQGKNVFIYDFVATVKIFQEIFYMMYYDPLNNYQQEHFLFIWLVTIMHFTFSMY